MVRLRFLLVLSSFGVLCNDDDDITIGAASFADKAVVKELVAEFVEFIFLTLARGVGTVANFIGLLLGADAVASEDILVDAIDECGNFWETADAVEIVVPCPADDTDLFCDVGKGPTISMWI